ncbi:MAG: hypothetical protein ACE37E_01250 [Hyphomicrobiales bacterium]
MKEDDEILNDLANGYSPQPTQEDLLQDILSTQQAILDELTQIKRSVHIPFGTVIFGIVAISLAWYFFK